MYDFNGTDMAEDKFSRRKWDIVRAEGNAVSAREVWEMSLNKDSLVRCEEQTELGKDRGRGV